MYTLLNSLYAIKCFFSFINKKEEKEVIKLSQKYNLTVSVAESCTGGLISSLLTDISGSSQIIFNNFVTYANSAKKKFINVNKDTIEKYGVVSEEVAKEMCEGLMQISNCNINITTTGIAGPTGGTEHKPVGLIYIGIASSRGTNIYKYQVNSKLDRRIIKYLFAKQALKYTINFIKKNYGEE